MTRQLHFEISSIEAPADVPIVICVGGARPMQRVTIHARLKDHYGVAWVSHATFVADERGRIDLERDAPVTGTYSGRDPMGLFWSMTSDDPTPTVTRTREALLIELLAESDDSARATAAVRRLVVPDGVSVRDVREQGVIGTFFQPPGPGPHPAVITLSGSSGGLYEPPAALLAGHGYAGLALAYFHFEDLPRELVRIPLEYFETALNWLRSQPAIRGDAIGVLGSSRGAELALLLGATFPEIRAVIGVAPSHVMQAGTETGFGASRPAWSFRGNPLPFVPRLPPSAPVDGKPLELTPMFLAALADEAAAERAAIAVEKIRGPVLILSPKDDQMWPSTMMGEKVMQRLRRYQHPFPFEHRAYEGAGHMISTFVPYLPATCAARRHLVRELVTAFGGDPKSTADARADGWARILSFLSASLDASPESTAATQRPVDQTRVSFS
jgi:dienelactone hydrolase